MSTQPAIFKSVKTKGANKMLNVRAPKTPSLNYSASNVEIAIAFNGKRVTLPIDMGNIEKSLKDAGKTLKLEGIIKSSNDGINIIDPTAVPFIHVPAYTYDEVYKDDVLVERNLVILDSVRDFRKDSRTLVQNNSESLLVRDLCELKEFKVEKKDLFDRGTWVEDTLVAYDNLHQLNVKVVDITGFLTRLFEKKHYGVEVPVNIAQKFIRKTVLNGAVMNNTKELKLFTLNSSSPAQTRKGEAAFFLVDSCPLNLDRLVELIHDSRARQNAVYRRFSASFKLQVFGKLKDGQRIFKIDKDPKRLDMHGSGSKPSQVHQKLFGKMKVILSKPYIDMVNELRTMTVLESVKPMKDGVKRRIAIVEDLFVTVSQEAIITKKPKEGQVDVAGIVEKPEHVKNVFRFRKNITDGGILVSEEMSMFLKEEGHFKGDYQSFQARGANGVKPFAYTVHKLRELSEVDMVLLGGSRKLNVLPSLLDGTFELSIVQSARMEEEKPNALVATQALLAMATPAENLKMLNMISTGRIYAAISNTEKALKLLNIEVAGEDQDLVDLIEDQEEDEDFGADMNPQERGIKRILSESPVALKDFVQKEALLHLMAKPLEKIRKGHVFMDDTAMKHMGFDLYMVATGLGDVIRDMEAGIDTPQMRYENSIPVGKVVVVKYGGGLRSGTALLIRYPILKHEEVQKAEAVVDFGENARAAQLYYEEASRLGFYQGLVLFNALDMMSEAMSGADFDGDTCLVTFNMYVVEPFQPRTMILDYFIDSDGNIEGGCPWSDPTEAPDVFEVLGDDMPEGLHVEQLVEDGKRTWNLSFNENDVHARPSAVYFVFNRMAAAHIVQTSKISSIGKWTNRLMNVEDVLLELDQEYDLVCKILVDAANKKDRARFEAAKVEAVRIKFEREEYDRLAKWLVCVVRWAIDEAKHGGAFASHLEHIIGHLEERPVASSLTTLHQSGAFFPTRLFTMTQV